jgi:hypothetical protein
MGVLCNISYAQSNKPFTVNGFGTIGLTFEDSSEVDFSRTYGLSSRDGLSVLPDSVLGLQGSLIINDKLDLFTQIVVDDVVSQKIDNYIEMAFMRYKFNRKLSLLAGRMNPNIYMLSDYRAVSHAYLWARPPIEFYSQVAFVESTDGLGIDYQTDFLNGYLKLRSVLGKSSTSLGEDNGNVTVKADNVLTLSAEWSTLNLSLSASYTKADISLSDGGGFFEIAELLDMFPASVIPGKSDIQARLGLEPRPSDYKAIGIKYDFYPFVFQAEASVTTIDWLISGNSKAAYASLGFYLNDVTPYILVSHISPEGPPFSLSFAESTPEFLVPSLTELAEVLNLTSEVGRIDQTTFAVGLRWDISQSIAFKCQYDHIRADLAGSASIIPPEQENVFILRDVNLNVIHAGISWVF